MIAYLLLSAAGALIAAHLATVVLYLHRLRRPTRGGGSIGRPPVTLLRPVCGLDPFDRETLESSFAQDYPDYEVIFCAPSDGDASVPLCRDLIAAHPERRARLLTGQEDLTRNPKLNNLAKGWEAATSDWVAMTDSNVLLPPDYLDDLVDAWQADTGLVSSPPIGTRPDGLWGSLECAFLNSNQARLQFASDSVSNGFAQGKTLFWKRDFLDKAGGIEVLGRYLAEDVNATKLVRASGLKIHLTALPFAQPIGRRTFREVWGRQLRWSRVRRDGFPGLFAAEPINGAVLPVLLAVAGVAAGGFSPWFSVAFIALWYGAEILLIRRAGWPSGWRDLIALPVRDLLLPLIWAATFLRRDIEWRGNKITAPTEGGADRPAVLADHD